jgi:thymidylate synthase (FAD)
MPINNDLPVVKLPTDLGFDEPINTEFYDHLDAIRTKLVSCPSIEELRNYIPDFCTATWAEQPFNKGSLSNYEKDKMIWMLFNGKLLPTAFETINCTFTIEGIDTQFVTHLIRHRMFSFSAQCTGDRSQRNDNAVVPHAIMNSPEMLERYKQLVNDSKQLYADMVDTKEISVMDARHILPKCLSKFYWTRGNIRDVMGFIKTRIDKQIQPTEDNLVAYYMWLELVRQYPMIVDCIDIHTPARYYISTARTGTGTNLYFPDEDSDEFEYNENDFLYQSTREGLNGTEDGRNTFIEKLLEVDDEIEDLRRQAYERYDFLGKK